MDWREELSSLAWLKYGPLILSKRGGPIERLTTRKVQLADGRIEHEVYATLRAGLIPELSACDFPAFMGSSHGSGTAPTQRRATHIAISEALERWAAMSIAGADGVRDSHGFAAFPGWGETSPREAALFEVIERFCLADALLGNRRFHQVATQSVTQIEFIRAQSPEDAFVLMGRYQDPELGCTYGFAARRNLEAAQRQVAIEIQRNLRSLRRARELRITDGDSQHPYERKLLAFTGGENLGTVDRVFRQAGPGFQPTPTPRLRIDQPVLGPWTTWTHVWRCALDEDITRRAMDDPNICLF